MVKPTTAAGPGGIGGRSGRIGTNPEQDQTAPAGTTASSVNHQSVPEELLDELGKALAQRLTSLVKGLGQPR